MYLSKIFQEKAMTDWYYVDGRERVGPVDQETILEMIQSEKLDGESYLWRKGFDDWMQLNDIPELLELIEIPEDYVPEDLPPSIDDIPPFVTEGLDWDDIDLNDPIFMVKIGVDRGGNEAEYGPYSLNQLKKASKENRVNAKTYVFATGMENWIFLGDIPIYARVFDSLPPAIEDTERRKHTRKPFVARMFFHDNQELYEGICRDVSVGGLQILVADFPARVGDVVTMNVHPENSHYNFVAKGRVVRVLDGNQGFSLRFEDLNEDAVSAINQYIRQV